MENERVVGATHTTSTTTRTSIECVFRTDVRREDAREVASCALLGQITQLDPSLCTVDRTACEACSRSFPAPAAKLNPVLPSLLFQICHSALASDPSLNESGESGGGGLSLGAHLRRVGRWASQNIERDRSEPRRLPACDVVLCFGDEDDVGEALDSLLSQVGVWLIIHLVDDGGSGEQLHRYATLPQVITHRNPCRLGVHATIHRLLPRLRTEFVAVQDPGCISRPHRLANAIEMMQERGTEIFGSAICQGSEIVAPQTPSMSYDRFLPAETLVFRRASLIDMGGFADRPSDADAEIVYRAHAESRLIESISFPLVDRRRPSSVPPLGQTPKYTGAERRASLRGEGIGFEMRRAQCDVVLPFYDQADYVHEAMESLLAQQDADVIVHLVDDCGPVADKVFRRWRSHASVRAYRNKFNIGPFATFNNLVDRFETDFVAVQDADDRSEPQRLWLATNWLRLADADIFGGRCRTFGNKQMVCPSRKDGNDRRQIDRCEFTVSHYPRPAAEYFLQNPTAVMRVDAFRQLGGYADFRDRQRNRTGVDWEFFAKAYRSGKRFSITRDVVVHYRIHNDSAMQSEQTGWGSRARDEAIAERKRRLEVMGRCGSLDPRVFGALNEFAGVTTPCPQKSVIT